MSAVLPPQQDTGSGIEDCAQSSPSTPHASRLTPHRRHAAEFNALAAYPPGGPRIVNRTIRNKLVACERGREFFDGERADGYGGLKDDGRWGPVAQFMIDHYRLAPRSRVLEIECEKGFLLSAFEALGMQVEGWDSSWYAVQHSAIRTAQWRRPLEVPEMFYHGHDLVICRGGVYTGTLRDAVRLLAEIQRLTRAHAFVTLAAYESEDDYRLLRAWSLLGCTILTKDEWREVMAHAGYTGDYSFVTARTLALRWSEA